MSPAGADIAHIIDLAVAPVFLIAGIGAILNVLVARLARVVDRGRMLEAAIASGPEDELLGRIRVELRALDLRMSRINMAVSLATLAALLVCVVIMLLFSGQLFAADLSLAISALFIAAMAALIVALAFFLGEVWVASRTIRVRTDLLGKR
jgi:hypothetical protein